MVELKRIYWGRQTLHATYLAVILWLGASFALALMPKANAGIGESAKSVADIFRGMFDSILAAVALPVLFVVTLTIAAAVIRARDVRRRDPVRRFSRQQRREGMARAGGQCEMEAGFRRRCSRPAEHGDLFIRGPKADPLPSRTSLLPAPDAIAGKGPGFRRRASRKDWNYDGGSTSCPTHPSASGNGSRSPDCLPDLRPSDPVLVIMQYVR